MARKLTISACLGIAVAALVMSPAVSDAATLDHAICYKMLDHAQIQGAVDMFATLQPEFSLKGCKLVKPVDFCVPATKSLNTATPPIASRTDIAGPALPTDYIGYLVRCPISTLPPTKDLTDQFGSHPQVRFGKAYKIYVPARKVPTRCGQVGRACGGACPKASDQCRITAGPNGTKACDCVPPPVDKPCGDKPDAAGMCGGECPNDANGSVQQCIPTTSATGAKVCACRSPITPYCGMNAATGMCGGKCLDPLDKCIVIPGTTQCGCAPPDPTPCGNIPGTVPQCGGDCPIATDKCLLQSDGKCACYTPPQGCGQNPLTGMCGGDCPTGNTCTLDTANRCSCQPPSCGIDAAGVCGGTCPTGGKCTVDATGACNCH